MKYKYPMTNDPIDKKDINELIKWLNKSPRLTMGPLTKQFEKNWASYINTKYSIFVNSGSSANLLMVYLGIASGRLKKGDKVIVPSCGWATSIAPIIQFGLKPIMVDADRSSFGVDFDEVERLVRKDKIKAIIVVHPLGVPLDKKRLLKLKNKLKLFVMEDCCASVGAKFADGTKIGTVGNVSSFSFYFGHQLSTIEGGMVNTSENKLYYELLMLRSHGWIKDLPKKGLNLINENNQYDAENGAFNFIDIGFNLRSTDLQAFIGIRQIKKADKIFKARNKNHNRYIKKMNENFTLQKTNNWPVSLHIGILAKNNKHRKAIIKALDKNKIENRVWSHGNLGKHPFWKKLYGEFDGPWANEIYSRGFILPTYPGLTNQDIDFICDVCNRVKI